MVCKDKNNNNKYISLTQASKQSRYSQEYLSLRARQGKLKAVKNGRNWETTQEWVKDYEQQVCCCKNVIKQPFNKARAVQLAACFLSLFVILGGISASKKENPVKSLATECSGLTSQMARAAENFGKSLQYNELAFVSDMRCASSYFSNILNEMSSGGASAFERTALAAIYVIKDIPKNENEFNEMAAGNVEWGNLNNNFSKNPRVAGVAVKNPKNIQYKSSVFLDSSLALLNYNSNLIGKIIGTFTGGMEQVSGVLDKAMGFVFAKEKNGKINNNVPLSQEKKEINYENMKSATISLMPEYPDTDFFSDEYNNAGNIVLKNDEEIKYYRWESFEDNQECYVEVFWMPPPDFQCFDNKYGFNISSRINGESENTAVLFSMLDSSNNQISFTDSNVLKNLSWKTNKFIYEGKPFFSSSNTDGKNRITFKIKLSADKGGIADIGEISFKYYKKAQ